MVFGICIMINVKIKGKNTIEVLATICFEKHILPLYSSSPLLC